MRNSHPTEAVVLNGGVDETAKLLERKKHRMKYVYIGKLLFTRADAFRKYSSDHFSPQQAKLAKEPIRARSRTYSCDNSMHKTTLCEKLSTFSAEFYPMFNHKYINLSHSKIRYLTLTTSHTCVWFI